MHIAFVAASFPTTERPTAGTFVKQFVWAMAKQGHRCTVIHPISIFERRRGKLPPRFSVETVGQSTIETIRPPYVSCSSRKIGCLHTGRWTQTTFERAVIRSIQKLENKPDIIYGHFLYIAGRAATVVGNSLGMPAIIGVGEGTFWTVDPFGKTRAIRDLSQVSGFIAVASHVRNGLVKQFHVPDEKIILAPNGVDLSKFKPMDRREARRELGIAPDLFLIVFVGNFDELKGARELIQAAHGLEGTGVAMIGSGPIAPESDNLIYRGPVAHDKLPSWLNAADIFVLPTREEGSCNAVIEALACGIPIVTSDGDYMDDLVDDKVAIRISPTNVKAIREAIITLKNDSERRLRMSNACIEKSSEFDINIRARRISDWMRLIIERELSHP